MIKDEIKEVWKIEFAKMSIDSSDIDEVFDRIYKKGFYRYSLFIKELNDGLQKYDNETWKKLPKISLVTINRLYIADILIRREIFRILVPIEVNIRASILNSVYDISKPRLTHDVFNDLLKKYEQSDHFQKMLVADRINSEKIANGKFSVGTKSKLDKFNKKIDKIVEKINMYYKDKTFDYFIDNIEFSHLSEIFKMMIKSNFNLAEWFDGKIDNNVYENINCIVEIRNAVMHHNIFVRNASLLNTKPSDNIKTLLSFVNSLFGDENEAVKSFYENWSKAFSKYNFYDILYFLEILYLSDLFYPNPNTDQ